jgi:hypothetical protein
MLQPWVMGVSILLGAPTKMERIGNVSAQRGMRLKGLSLPLNVHSPSRVRGNTVLSKKRCHRSLFTRRLCRGFSSKREKTVKRCV